MLFEFALFVLVTAFLVTFSTDLAEIVKKAWGSPRFMNLTGMFFASLFGGHYQLYLAKTFGHLLYFAESLVLILKRHLHFLPKAGEILSIFTLLCFSFVPLLCLQLGMFIIYRRSYPYPKAAIWYPWVFLATVMSLVSFNLNTLLL